MTSNPQSGPQASGTEGPAHDQPQSFTPEQLRKAARVQVILYVVMAVFIILPFLFMWLRKADPAPQPESPPLPPAHAEAE